MSNLYGPYDNVQSFEEEWDLVNNISPMNPETDDLLPTSHPLREGMIVLIADRDGMVYDFAFAESQRRALEFNRWCTVTELATKVEENYHEGYVTFVGVYSDGTKIKRFAQISTPWYVKKDTLQNIPPREEDDLQEVIDFLEGAIQATPAISYQELKDLARQFFPDMAPGEIERVVKKASETAVKNGWSPVLKPVPGTLDKVLGRLSFLMEKQHEYSTGTLIVDGDDNAMVYSNDLEEAKKATALRLIDIILHGKD